MYTNVNDSPEESQHRGRQVVALGLSIALHRQRLAKVWALGKALARNGCLANSIQDAIGRGCKVAVFFIVLSIRNLTIHYSQLHHIPSVPLPSGDHEVVDLMHETPGAGIVFGPAFVITTSGMLGLSDFRAFVN